MQELVERRVWLLRRALGLAGVPRARDVWRLVEFLAGFVRVVHDAPGQSAWCDWLADGTALISVPTQSHDIADARVVLEELAHALLQTRLPAGCAPNRLENWMEARDEREAAAFCEAFWLPLEHVQALRHEVDAEDILWESGTSREALARRMAATKGLRLDWRTAPAWSAWCRYRMEEMCGRIARFRLVPDLPELPEIEVPYTPGTRAAVYRDLCYSLAVLQPHEFALRYRDEAAGPAADVTPRWDEFVTAEGWTL